MPNSTSQSSTSPLYLPYAARTQSGDESAGVLPTYIENGVNAIETYARNEPWAFAAWVFGVGFVLGWKLKPW